LKEQLKEGGVLVAPVGGEFSQVLNKYFKKQGKLEKEKLCDCRFVKLVGEYGFSE
jgi:protein-L-isoaspartate(D-aspartate) O-methyltransferase